MPNFAYSARDQRGTVQTGFLDGIDEDDVVAVLQHRGLIVTSIAKKDAKEGVRQGPMPVKRQAHQRRMHTGVKTDDHVMLCQQLATLVDAGVPLLKSLEVVSNQVESRQLLTALDDIHHDVEAGSSFRDALGKHPKVFSKMWMNLVGTGEASGHLAQSLQQLARHFESAQHLQNETKTALTYPIFLMVAAVGVLAVFVYVIIPKFTGMFATMGMELPPLTKMVIAISNAARQYWVLVILGGISTVFGLRWYLKTESGSWMMDQLVLQLPVFQALFTCVQLAEFSRGLATLLESGVPLLSSLEILENSATNRVYGRAIGWIREAVKEGKSMAAPMADCGLFPPMTVQMVMVGEEVGELGKMVSRIARHYEERVEIFIARMTRLFEPLAIVVMGLLVLVIVLSVFLPIFKMAGMKG